MPYDCIDTESEELAYESRVRTEARKISALIHIDAETGEFADSINDAIQEALTKVESCGVVNLNFIIDVTRMPAGELDDIRTDIEAIDGNNLPYACHLDIGRPQTDGVKVWVSATLMGDNE